jgi:hypothetical protein
MKLRNRRQKNSLTLIVPRVAVARAGSLVTAIAGKVAVPVTVTAVDDYQLRLSMAAVPGDDLRLVFPRK